MNIQLMVSDIDGTFVSPGGVPSYVTLESIQNLRRKGIGFTLCSGRGNPGTRPIVDLLKLDLPYIVSGGAAILEPNGCSVIYQNVLADHQVQALIDLGLKTQCDLVIHTPMQLLVLSSAEFWKKKCEERWIKKEGWKNVFRCESQLELLNKEIIHINFFNQDNLLPHIAEQVENLNENVHTNIVFSKLEITNCKVNKGVALSILADYLKIPLKNILSIGDDVNDISMLKASGIGVAMKNSSPQVLRQVDYIAPDCNENGLASMINYLLSDTLNCLRSD